MIKKTILIFCTLLLTLVLNATELRRPVDANHPMWLIHIDTWNYPDPQRIIDLIPEDIRPYCVFNISLSISHDENTGVFNIVRNGYEAAKSWVRTCAENRVWCTVQPASGAFCHFPDNDMTIFEEFFKDYPNFLGFNYAEQFWGFNDKFSVTVPTRFQHFSKLMELTNKYGGYLIISWCGGIWHFDTDPLAMMKSNVNLLNVCKEHPENLIMCYKYTSSSCWYNNESICLGTFVAGLCDNYGIRFDQCGWNMGEGEKYPTAAGIGPVLDQTVFNGATVFDGPELIWQQDFKENWGRTTADGYKVRDWEHFPQFDNIWIDYYRKLLDGSMRLLTRHEVMDRTKMVLINDINSGNTQAKFATPNTLYDGLYKQDGEGYLQENKLWFKKTGRYPAIPVVPAFYDTYAKVIPLRIRSSQFNGHWSSTEAKVEEMNKYCPEEYQGNLFAGRENNTWVVYYPFKYGTHAWAKMPFQYNTCDSMRLDFSEYSNAVINEFTDSVIYYLNNYRVDSTQLKEDVIKIYGCKQRPTYTYVDRASHQASVVNERWNNNVWTLSVKHNGPLDIKVKCSGTATGRLTYIKKAQYDKPAIPQEYTGIRQYEAEFWEYKNASVVGNGVGRGIENYTGQGYLNFGTDVKAIVRDTISVPADGTYKITVRYSAPNADVMHVLMYINKLLQSGNQGRIRLPKTADASTWAEASKEVKLNKGKNVFYLKGASVATPQQLYIDRITVETIDDPTGINNSRTDKITETVYYTIGGIRVNRMDKSGVYIVRERTIDGTTKTYKIIIK